MNTDQSYCFVFVCQAGRLEIDALLLALSLQMHVKCGHELVAAIPMSASRWGRPNRIVLDQLERMNVRIVEIENQIDQEYPIGNKVSCLSIPTGMDKLVFVDSDVLCLREFGGGAEFCAPFNAKFVDTLIFGKDPSEWEAVYSAVGLPLPSIAGETTVSGEATLPYY
ncbi:MAG: hypothetical protein GY930_15405, partial [bacterium]|nr:hypothetical protein [bacterium]